MTVWLGLKHQIRSEQLAFFQWLRALSGISTDLRLSTGRLIMGTTNSVVPPSNSILVFNLASVILVLLLYLFQVSKEFQVCMNECNTILARSNLLCYLEELGVVELCKLNVSLLNLVILKILFFLNFYVGVGRYIFNSDCTYANVSPKILIIYALPNFTSKLD